MLLNFFNLENLAAAGYLILAGYATVVAVILALKNKSLIVVAAVSCLVVFFTEMILRFL